MQTTTEPNGKPQPFTEPKRRWKKPAAKLGRPKAVNHELELAILRDRVQSAIAVLERMPATGGDLIPIALELLRGK